ncbi:hypothetical protein [Fluviicola sp.]|uniref:hypothetical protein n=1 Tax=Fluviicola sp. TaxID=1917219 RepID=UPI0031D30DC8
MALPTPSQNTFICNKTIIINLIKQDLINWKMIYSLQKMQIRADDYQLDIGPIIFEMMDLENRNDASEIFDKYVEMSKPILKTKANQSNRRIDLLASKIYNYLESLSQ